MGGPFGSDTRYTANTFLFLFLSLSLLFLLFHLHNEEQWNAGVTNTTVPEEDVHDRVSVCQGHVSAFPSTPSAVARDSFASQLCLPIALTLGRFASSLCLCLCLCQQGLVGTGQSPRRDPQALCLTSTGPEQSAYSNSMLDRETRAHSSTSSTVSSGQLPPTPCVLRQSYTLMMVNIVHVQLETAEHVASHHHER